jgi:hypothetical protein
MAELGESIPQIRHEVETENLGEASVVRPCDDSSKPKHNTNVGEDNLIILMRCEHNCRRFEVCAKCQSTAIK